MRLLIKLWKFIRELSGDDAYEKYLEHQTRSHPESGILSRKEFFQAETKRKWESVRRCC